MRPCGEESFTVSLGAVRADVEGPEAVECATDDPELWRLYAEKLELGAVLRLAVLRVAPRTDDDWQFDLPTGTALEFAVVSARRPRSPG